MDTLLALYLSPFAERRAFARRFRDRYRERGVRLVLADDALEEEDLACFDDAIALPRPEEVGGAVDAVLAYARRVPLCGLFVQNEAALLSGALSARALELPGLAVEAAHACVNKYRSRTLLASAGVPVPRFTLASSAEDVRRFASEAGGYPVILKPIASVLGRFVIRVDGAAGVEAAVAELRAWLPRSADIARLRAFAARAAIDLGCDPLREFLVESFAAGDAVETDGIVCSSGIRSFGVTEQVLAPRGRFFIDGYLLPAERPAEEIRAIEAVSAAALRASGVRAAGYSIELRVQGGAATIIEVNPRLGEDDGFAHLFANALGAAPLDLAVDLALGTEPPPLEPARARFALAYRSTFSGGRVVRVPGAGARAASAQDVLEIGVCVEEGARIALPRSRDFFPHLAYALASDSTSSRAAYARARRAVDALDFEIAATE